ncbi:helix-turn-helix domain-containing protein [Curtobacterium aurantiacum]|uniref:helix-turn-helix domain-containing protein n=1 Tax=Curtobacterium aurantiacum TaxID=3236919 RepID=UPI001BDFED13|nr:helix-turn-helix domain-containing protein [Curtobacterium flaccumfaciens]MBT1676786.1 helix-turn-helix transcriptional regulator [Curtobacterium flaccumfaciens pv. flaccumfaciens]
MQSNEWTAEQRFGSMVLSNRKALGMSQKDLSEHLADAGLILDNSAVSRIEKGTRALRLGESIVIARVLGFSLADFEDSVPPAEDFKRREATVDNALGKAHKSLVFAAEELDGLAFIAELHPEVLRDVPSPKPITSTQEFLQWKVREWHEKFIYDALGARFETAELRDGVRELLTTVATSAVDSFVGPMDNR